MRNFAFLSIAVALVVMLNQSASAADLVQAKDGSGVQGYKDTPKLPWCEFLVHDPDRPAPKRVDPGPAPEKPASVPADAVVLFDGKDLGKWKETKGWKVVDGMIEAGEGAFSTIDKFGSFQLHVEFVGPKDFKGHPFNSGNNGVLLHGLYEIQIFDSFNGKLYPDGQCGSIYGQTPPMVNVTREPGQWQTYDIAFTAPVFDGQKLVSPARVTVLHNGVLVHNNEEIRGATGHRILPKYTPGVVTGPIALSGHACPVRFRSIWIRPLDKP